MGNLMYFEGLRFTVFLCICGLMSCAKQPLRVIVAEAGPNVSRVLDEAEKHEVQIIYIQIDRDKNQTPHFQEYTLREDPGKYFYPASTVKFPVAVLALEKLYELHIPGLDKTTRMRIDSTRVPQTAMLLDSTSETGLPSIGYFIHRIFLVSDNTAHNRLYEFVGQEEIHHRLRRHGFGYTRILHRLSAPEFSPEDNRYTNPVSFYHDDTLIFHQPERFAAPFIDSVEIRDQYKGTGYIDGNRDHVEQPFDFTRRNFYPLREQVRVLKAVMFPESLPEEERFCIRPEDYQFLWKSMGMLPRESEYPQYDTTEFYDSYVKFFIFGTSKAPIPEHIRIFNKVGWAYGYMTDCAYVADFENGIEFILAATILANADGIFNDGKYEFETVALPFLADLGRAVYAYELRRKRTHAPDLSELSTLFTDPEIQ